MDWIRLQKTCCGGAQSPMVNSHQIGSRRPPASLPPASVGVAGVLGVLGSSRRREKTGRGSTRPTYSSLMRRIVMANGDGPALPAQSPPGAPALTGPGTSVSCAVDSSPIVTPARPSVILCGVHPWATKES